MIDSIVKIISILFVLIVGFVSYKKGKDSEKLSSAQDDLELHKKYDEIDSKPIDKNIYEEKSW